MEQLPAGWNRREDGILEYIMLPEEVKEMKKTDNFIFILATLNILQALFLVILVLSHFCNH